MPHTSEKSKIRTPLWAQPLRFRYETGADLSAVVRHMERLNSDDTWFTGQFEQQADEDQGHTFHLTYIDKQTGTPLKAYAEGRIYSASEQVIVDGLIHMHLNAFYRTVARWIAFIIVIDIGLVLLSVAPLVLLTNGVMGLVVIRDIMTMKAEQQKIRQALNTAMLSLKGIAPQPHPTQPQPKKTFR